jgi:hypothetical protein
MTNQQYWIWKNQAAEGPYSAEKLRELQMDLKIDADTLVCPDGGAEWVTLRSFSVPTPPLPPAASVAVSVRNPPALQDGSDTSDVWNDFIGTNRDYYLSKWNRHKGKEWFVSWNWAGFFFGCLWLLYRKMYVLFFAIYFSIVFFSYFLPISGIGMAMLTGMYGNAFYRRHTTRKIREIRSSVDPEHQERMIKEEGGTSVLAVFGGIVLIVVITAIEIAVTSAINQ